MATVMELEPEALILDGSFARLDADSATVLTDALAGYNGALIALGNRVQGLPGEVSTLVEGQQIPGCPDPAKTTLPDSVGAVSDEVIDLGEVRGTRGVRPAKWRRFGGAAPPEFTVGPVHVTLHPGKVLWLRGANGSGKTMLLRAIAGLDGVPAPKVGVSLMLQRPEDQVADSTVGGVRGRRRGRGTTGA